MKVKIISILFLALSYCSTYASTFKNPLTGQTMSVSCALLTKEQCKANEAEAYYRVQNNTNPGEKTLLGARIQDKKKALDSKTRNGIANARAKAVQSLNNTRESAARAANKAKEAAKATAQNAADRTRNAATSARESATQFGRGIRSQAAEEFDKINGRRIRVQLPLTYSNRNTMTLWCLTDEECEAEKKEAAQALMNGATESSLGAYRLRHARAAAGTAGEAAQVAAGGALLLGETIGRGLQKAQGAADHYTCKNKVERHARDFDYNFIEYSELSYISYTAKIDYINEKLTEEGYLEACAAHLEAAELSYQLEWVSGGIIKKETSIFDGLRRSEEGVQYWEEPRESRPSNSSISQ